MRSEPVEVRHARMTNRSGECWEWTGGIDANGYGRIQVRRRSMLAHRIGWELAHGEIPDGRQVLHHCDNRRCVRPAHLFLGDNADNVADRVAKKRSGGARRERNGHARLTADQVAAIRARYRPSPIGRPPRGTRRLTAVLAEEYGVTRSTIYHIVRGWTWRE